MLARIRSRAIIREKNETVYCSRKIDYDNYKLYRYGIREDLSEIPSVEIVDATSSLIRKRAMTIRQLAGEIDYGNRICGRKKALIIADGYVMEKR